MKIVTAAAMRLIDRAAIDGEGIPSEELMEHAGSGIAERILSDIIGTPDETKAVVFCGKGNNGGDGYVIARYLHEAGVEVVVYFLGPPDKLSADARLNFNRAAENGVELVEITSLGDLPENLQCDIIIDAVFGTGFSGAPRGMSADIIEYMNGQDCLYKVAVDLPSGLNADDGQIEGAVVQADYTYPLALPKFGLYLTPGRELAGNVEVVPIGIPDTVVESFELKDELITDEMVMNVMPVRKPDGHKGDFGRVLVVAGSTGMTGAAAMAGESALRSGCGLVRVACPGTTQPVLAVKLTEVMTHPLPDVGRKGALALRGLGEIRQLVRENDAVVIGPGLGRHHETQELVRRLVVSLQRPAIIDADGLNALAGHPEILSECRVPLVLTPHPGEFERLTGTMPPHDIAERSETVRQFVSQYKVVLVLKGSPTLLAAPDGMCYLNPTGNNGMASGGSGDVLSGIIGSFLAQGMRPLDAAMAGVFVHGLTGDFVADSLTARAMIAGDMIRALPYVFEALE